LNLYEVRIDDKLINDVSILKVFLFNCKCAIFFVDITNKESFESIQSLMDAIKLSDFPYLRIILVQNKIDIESERKITTNEIEEFAKSYSSIENISISLKTGANIDSLLNQIYNIVNEKKNNLPCDLISVSLNRNIDLGSYIESLSFVLIGDSTVGKSCFFKRYFRNEFVEGILHTIGIDKEAILVKIGDLIYKITLWDTAGQEKFRFLPKKYYKNANGILLLFDVTNQDSFNNVSIWMNDVKENVPSTNSENGKQNINAFLIGNKIDLPNREVTKEQAEMQAKSLGMKYYEISCKMNMNIPEVMQCMILECYNKTNDKEKGFGLKQKKITQNKKCC
jgi:small GTP-binding protein